MFSLLLMLVVAPQSPGDTLILRQRQLPGGETIHTAVPECSNGRFQQAAGQPDAGLDSRPLYRADGSVRGYWLLERSVEGCSRPVSFALPGSPPEFAPGSRPLQPTPEQPGIALPDLR